MVNAESSGNAAYMPLIAKPMSRHLPLAIKEPSVVSTFPAEMPLPNPASIIVRLN